MTEVVPIVQVLTLNAIPYSVSGSTYTLTDNDIPAEKLDRIRRAAAQCKFVMSLVANDITLKPAGVA